MQSHVVGAVVAVGNVSVVPSTYQCGGEGSFLAKFELAGEGRTEKRSPGCNGVIPVDCRDESSGEFRRFHSQSDFVVPRLIGEELQMIVARIPVEPGRFKMVGRKQIEFLVSGAVAGSDPSGEFE